VSLDIDCCLSEGKSINLNNIHLDLRLKNIINHLDDLRIGSHKVDDIEKLISEQEWKIKHSNTDLSPLLPILYRNGHHKHNHVYLLLLLLL
jgi:hypothetical protein